MWQRSNITQFHFSGCVFMIPKWQNIAIYKQKCIFFEPISLCSLASHFVLSCMWILIRVHVYNRKQRNKPLCGKPRLSITISFIQWNQPVLSQSHLSAQENLIKIWSPHHSLRKHRWLHIISLQSLWFPSSVDCLAVDTHDAFISKASRQNMNSDNLSETDWINV